MDEDLPDVIEAKERRPLYRRERHLASAITTTEISYVLKHRERPQALRPHHRRILEDVGDKDILPASSFLSWCCTNIDTFCNKRTGEEDVLRRAATVARELAAVSYEHYYKTVPSPLISIPLPTSTLFARLSTTWTNIINSVSQTTEARKIVEVGNWKIIFDAEICYIGLTDRTCFLIPYTLILCFADMCDAWFNVHMYASLFHDKYPGQNLEQEVISVFNAMRSLISETQQTAYQLFKMWPSLVIGTILKYFENSPSFIDTITKDLPWHLKQTPFYLMCIRPPTTPCQAMMFLELAGLWKTHGHPVVNMNKSSEAWCSKGTVMKLDLDKPASRINNMFKKEFCRQYYKTHKKWPNLMLTPETPQHIRDSYYANEWGETSYLRWDPELFDSVTLKKTFEFNYHVDTIDIISDKAIIPKLSEWVYEYDSKAFRTLHGRFPTAPPPTTKSVVIHYLTTVSFDCQEIISLIDSGIIPQDWRVMVAVPKEREFKEEDARCYGKMTPEMRAYQVVTEKNLSDVIFRYVKHQSMTLSEEQLTKTLYRMSHPDFSSWCTHFRAELLHPLFKSLDSLFGLEHVYSFTHVFPLISYLLFQDRYFPPDQDAEGNPVEGPRCLKGIEAWLEGLRQKGWTLATILIILIAAHRCDTTASLLGQGDNQVIVLRIPSKQYLEERGFTPETYTDQFLNVLEQICVEAGIVIKVPESWRSRRLLEYGRRYYLDGVQVSGALKKVSRLTSEANQTVPTLNTLLAGVFSGGASVAGDDSSPIPAYLVTALSATMTLYRRHPQYRLCSIEWMVTLLSMNRSVGGYPVVLFPQFALRATQDPLSLGLSVLHHLLKHPRYREQVFLLLDITKPSRIDHIQLIKDPSSIPLNIPPQPENMLRNRLKEGLPTLVKNEQMKKVFSADAEQAEASLKRDLLAIEPVNPKLLCKIWQLSNVGVREKVIGKFVTSRSIQGASLGLWLDERALLSTVAALEDRTANYYMIPKRRPFTATLESSPCVTRLTQILREMLWGLQLEGITMPTPTDKISVMPWNHLEPAHISSSIMMGWAGTPEHNCIHERGPYTPYIGSQTRVRSRRAALQVLEVGSTVENVKELLELRSWVRGDSGLQGLLKKLIEEKTHLTMEALEPFTAQVYSGMLSHRLPCPALRRGALWNGCPNVLTWARIVSDTATFYAKQGTNYNICFQEDFLYGLSVIAEWYRSLGHVPPTLAIVLGQKCCVWEFPPEMFELDRSEYPGLPLVKVVESLTHVEDRHLIPTSPSTHPRVSYTVHAAHKMAAWILHVREEEFVTSLENRAIHESIHAAFLNLTEFKSILMEQFIPCLLFYLILYDRSFIQNGNTYFDIIYSHKKTAYDVLLDTLMACGRMGDLYMAAGHPASVQESDTRSALYLALTKLVDEGYLSVIQKGAYMTPDNAERVWPRLVKLVLYLLHEPQPPETVKTYSEYTSFVDTLQSCNVSTKDVYSEYVYTIWCRDIYR